MLNDFATSTRALEAMETLGINDNPEYLVRAKSEVLRELRAMLDAGVRLTLNFPSDARTASSVMIFIDENANSLLLEYPVEWKTLADTAAVEGIMLSCVFDDAKIEFQGGVAIVEDMGGSPVIRFDLPEFLWRFQRRSDQRHALSGLKMNLNLGFLEAEGEITDLSRGGIGVVYCEPDVQLQPGEVLEGCTVTLPGVGQIAVDMKVQYQAASRAPDGRDATRVGCEFSGLSASARQMIARYLDALSG